MVCRAWFQPLHLTSANPGSKFAFKLNLRRYAAADMWKHIWDNSWAKPPGGWGAMPPGKDGLPQMGFLWAYDILKPEDEAARAAWEKKWAWENRNVPGPWAKEEPPKAKA
jgi:hypothetical protein